jgi:hypothetical protein
MSKPKGSEVLLTFSRARQQLGVSLPELLRLILASGVVPVRQRRGSALWCLRSADVLRLERLTRRGIPRNGEAP